MQKTKIEWSDSTWNPVTGCLHDCEYCYARGIAHRFGGGYWQDRHDLTDPFESPWSDGYYEADGTLHVLDEPLLKMDDEGNESRSPYPFYFDPTFHRYNLDKPERWRKPKTIFVGSMCDLFGEWVPDEWITAVFDACATAPQHRYLFLTKNPNRYVSLCEKGLLPLEHWYGITRDSKKAVSRRIYSTNHNFFASYEPLLEDIGDCGCFPWIIIGAETGNRGGKVKTELAWVDNLVNCMSARNNYTKIFMKDSLLPIVGAENMRREFPWEVSK